MRKSLLVASLLILSLYSTSSAEPAKKTPSSPLQAAQLRAEDITFSTPDGYELHGSFFPARPDAPVVLLLHQLGSDHNEMTGLARMLQERGINAVAYDARGHGKSKLQNGHVVSWERYSTREFEGMEQDMDAALAFLHKAKKIKKDVPVGLVGSSIQSSTGLIFASEHPEVGAVVMLSPGLDYHGLDTTGPMKQYGRRPVFMAVSITDSKSYKAVRELRDLSRGPKKVNIVSDANGGHGVSMFRAKPELLEEAADWLSKHLTQPSNKAASQGQANN